MPSQVRLTLAPEPMIVRMTVLPLENVAFQLPLMALENESAALIPMEGLNVLFPSTNDLTNCGAEAAAVNQGSKRTPAETNCPEPGPDPDGPEAEFHQFRSALTRVPAVWFFNPAELFVKSQFLIVGLAREVLTPA